MNDAKEPSTPPTSLLTRCLRVLTHFKKKPHKKKQSWGSLTVTILVALCIRFFIFSPFVIPSGSMIPTLLVGDYLFVTCFSYGYCKYTVPFGYYLPGLDGRFLQWQEPAYGDAVVFRPAYNVKMDYVKRLMGRPGDTVQMRGGRLYINGHPLPLEKEDVYDQRADQEGQRVVGTTYIQTMPNGVKHRILKIEPFGQATYDDSPVWTVPKDHYFVMGDNRDNSMDSRSMHNIGFVHKKYLIGKPFGIFFSLDGRSRWWEVWKWPYCIRFSRLLNLLN